MSSAGVIVCESCCFRCTTYRHWLRHTFEAHSMEPTFQVHCGINGCPSSFQRYSSMLSHISRKHEVDKDLCYNPSVVSVPNPSVTSVPEANGGHEESHGDLPEDDSSGLDKENSSTQGNRSIGDRNSSESAALYLLTLKEKHRLTQASIDYALGHVRHMTKFIIQDIRSAVEHRAQQYFLDSDNAIQVPDFSSCFSGIDPICGLETEHLQSKFYKEHFNLLVSLINAFSC